ncbi:PREDICTED: uncharacterized protein LOC109149345 [Ipomoea nil]|uniref:uncharacterized protein LOC109149345 n=1 Tax=Ipomoea nil TaxID=35883 RepID=UPI00090136D7|nr:PREDICTED: uncharacterized protein LOC109149345 [Ipomoea nil]
MVGVFSRFSVTKAAHRRAQSALDERETCPQNCEAAGASAVAGGEPTTTTTHGIEVAVEFKPIEHPVEPLDNDSPIQCPLPEPSILNDGRIWRERVSAVRGRPVMEQEGAAIEAEVAATKSKRQTNRPILPSISAPEHSILKLLEESGI